MTLSFSILHKELDELIATIKDEIAKYETVLASLKARLEAFEAGRAVIHSNTDPASIPAPEPVAASEAATAS